MPATVTKKDRRSANCAVPSNYRGKNPSAGMSTPPMETCTLLQPGWPPSPPGGASTTPIFSSPVAGAERSHLPDLGRQLVMGMGPEEFREAFQDQLADRKLSGRDERLFHAGLEAVNEAMHLTGRRPFSSIEDLMDALVRALNEEFGTSYPNTDEVQRRMAQPSNEHSINIRVVQLLTLASLAQKFAHLSGVGATSSTSAASCSEDSLYPNLGAKTDEFLCATDRAVSPCVYYDDPRPHYPEVILLNEMDFKHERLKPNTNYIFVEKPDGRVFVVPRKNEFNLNHSHLANAESVCVSGEFHTDKLGRVWKITNISGHYQPGPTPYIDPRDCSVHRRDNVNPIYPFFGRLRALGVPMSENVGWGALTEHDQGFIDALKNCMQRREIRAKYHIEL